MGEMRELKTEIIMPRLTVDERPTRSSVIRIQRRWRVDVFGRYWTPRSLAAVALALLALAGLGWAAWRLLGGTTG